MKMWKVGIVGARGLSTILGFQALPNVQVEALCDLDESVLSEKSRLHGIPKTYRVYEDMLASDIDIVVVATPMQLHVQQTLAALAAGKHVLSEVTAGTTMDELWWLVEAVEKSGKTYMMAENYCYIPEVQWVGNIVKAGLFGEVYYGEGEYLHEIRNLTHTSSGTPTWRNWWQLGKRGLFYPTHSLGPVMQWFGADHIESVSCLGTGWHTAPQFRQEDTSVGLIRMKSGKLIRLRVDCISRRPHNLSYYSVQGTQGCYEAPRGLGDTHKIYLAQGRDGTGDARWQPLSDYSAYLPERYRNATEEQKKAGHWGGDFFIVEDFMEAVQHGTKPPIDVYDACEWTAVALLSEQSVTQRGKTVEMPDFRKRGAVRSDSQ